MYTITNLKENIKELENKQALIMENIKVLGIEDATKKGIVTKYNEIMYAISKANEIIEEALTM